MEWKFLVIMDVGITRVLQVVCVGSRVCRSFVSS